MNSYAFSTKWIIVYDTNIYILQSKGKINQIYDCPSNIYGGSCFVHFLCCSIFFYVRGLSEGAYTYDYMKMKEFVVHRQGGKEIWKEN